MVRFNPLTADLFTQLVSVGQLEVLAIRSRFKHTAEKSMTDKNVRL